MEPTGGERHRRSPEGERAGASESIEASAVSESRRVSLVYDHTKRPRRESNPHLRFRKPPFYPLNYGDRKSKSKKTEGRSPASAISGTEQARVEVQNQSSNESGCVCLVVTPGRRRITP